MKKLFRKVYISLLIGALRVVSRRGLLSVLEKNIRRLYRRDTISKRQREVSYPEGRQTSGQHLTTISYRIFVGWGGGGDAAFRKLVEEVSRVEINRECFSPPTTANSIVFLGESKENLEKII